MKRSKLLSDGSVHVHSNAGREGLTWGISHHVVADCLGVVVCTVPGRSAPVLDVRVGKEVCVFTPAKQGGIGHDGAVTG